MERSIAEVIEQEISLSALSLSMDPESDKGGNEKVEVGMYPTKQLSLCDTSKPNIKPYGR